MEIFMLVEKKLQSGFAYNPWLQGIFVIGHQMGMKTPCLGSHLNSLNKNVVPTLITY